MSYLHFLCMSKACLFAERHISLGCLNGSKNNYNTIYASVTGIWTNKGFYMYK